MTVTHALSVTLLVLTVTLGMLGLGLVGIKSVREARVQRRETLVRAVRPAVFAALDGDVEVMTALAGRRSELAEQVAISLLPKLRGADRARLAAILDDAGVIDRAVHGLRSRSSVRVERAAELLGGAGAHRALPELIALLDHRRSSVRDTAARALGKIGDASAVPALIDGYDTRALNAHTTSMAVIRIGPPGGPALVDALAESRSRAATLVVDLVGTLGLLDGVAQITPLLDDPTLRVSAVRALGRIGHPASSVDLIVRLQHELDAGDEADIDHSIALVTALGQIGDLEAIDVLTSSLGRSHRLSFVAAAALSSMGPRRAVGFVPQRSATMRTDMNSLLAERGTTAAGRAS